MKCQVYFVALFSLAFGLDLPANFQKCHRSGELNECLKNAIQDGLPKLEKGLPEFKFPVIQPLNIPQMTIGEGTGAVHVVQNYKNVEIYNIIHAKIEKVDAHISDTTMKLTIDAFIDELKLEADYDFNGQVLVLPIVGKGKSTIKLDKLKATVVLTGATIEKRGKTFVEVKDVKLELKPEKVSFNFENLFNGNQQLGTEMNRLLNDNWSEVFQDVRSGYEQSLALIIHNIANLIFTKIPYSDLLPL